MDLQLLIGILIYPVRGPLLNPHQDGSSYHPGATYEETEDQQGELTSPAEKQDLGR